MSTNSPMLDMRKGRNGSVTRIHIEKREVESPWQNDHQITLRGKLMERRGIRTIIHAPSRVKDKCGGWLEICRLKRDEGLTLSYGHLFIRSQSLQSNVT